VCGNYLQVLGSGMTALGKWCPSKGQECRWQCLCWERGFQAQGDTRAKAWPLAGHRDEAERGQASVICHRPEGGEELKAEMRPPTERHRKSQECDIQNAVWQHREGGVGSFPRGAWLGWALLEHRVSLGEAQERTAQDSILTASWLRALGSSPTTAPGGAVSYSISFHR
jgi:hypothetical protein